MKCKKWSTCQNRWGKLTDKIKCSEIEKCSEVEQVEIKFINLVCPECGRSGLLPEKHLGKKCRGCQKGVLEEAEC